MNLIRFLLLSTFIAATTLAVSGRPVSADTGKLLNPVEVSRQAPGTQMGDATYAQVNSAWLHQFYNDYRSELARLGVVKWDSRFNCRHFASYYAELAQSRFFTANFQSSTAAKALALGPVRYQKDNKQGGHAIIMALTEKGKIFIEPQTGQEVTLTQSEQASIFFSVM